MRRALMRRPRNISFGNSAFGNSGAALRAARQSAARVSLYLAVTQQQFDDPPASVGNRPETDDVVGLIQDPGLRLERQLIPAKQDSRTKVREDQFIGRSCVIVVRHEASAASGSRTSARRFVDGSPIA